MLVAALPLDWDAEADLVRRAKEGDREAWTTLYHRHQDVIFRYSLARLHHVQDAEDIVAQTFLRAVKSIGGYRHQGKPFVSWLYRIAQNLIRDQARKAKRRPEVSLEDLDHAAFELGPEATLTRLDLMAAIDSLNSAQRDVLLLRFFVGLPMKEVAFAIGRSEAAAYSLQVRGIESLRRRILSNDR
jgi:RNA polymerase sigma-70 factor (ECF subfamily)